jgi:hypothetical protein
VIVVRLHRQFPFAVATIRVLVEDIQTAGVGYVVAYAHRCTDMRDDAVELVVVELLLVLFLVALVAKAFQNEGSRTVAGDLFHASGKAFYVENQQTWKHLERYRSNRLGVATAFITAEVIFHTKVLSRYARILKILKVIDESLTIKLEVYLKKQLRIDGLRQGIMTNWNGNVDHGFLLLGHCFACETLRCEQSDALEVLAEEVETQPLDSFIDFIVVICIDRFAVELVRACVNALRFFFNN